MNTFEMAKETFDELFGALTISVFLFDKDGGLINANQSFLDLTGISLEDVTTLSVMSFLKKVFKERWSFRGLINKHVTEITDISGRSFSVGVNYKKLKIDDESYGGGLGFIADLREVNASREKVKKITIEYEALKEQLAGEAPDIDLQKRKKLEQDVKEANEFLENVLESCGDGIVIMDATAKIIRSNKFFADMLGKKRDEVEDRYIYELVPPMDTFKSTTGETIKLDQAYTDNQMNHAMRFFQTGEDVQIENWQWYIFHKNGDIIPLESSANIQRDSEGALSGIVMSARDITKRKKAEKEIEEAKDYLENVIESCGDGICILDNTGIITRVNESFSSMLGKTKEEIEGVSVFRLGPSEGTFQLTTGETTTLDQAYNNYRMGILKREFTPLGDNFKIESLDFFLFHKNGDVVPLELTVTFQQDCEGNFMGGVFSARDITERKKAEKALQDAYEFQRRFFTNITHEFRTPLTLAIGPLEGILRGEFGKVSKAIQGQLSVALRNSRQLLKLINQLLDFSRLESGVKHVVHEKKDLKKFIAAITDSFSLIAKKKKIKLTLSPVGDIPHLSIDPGKMEKALFNLIGNAFKFTPEKGCVTVNVESVSDAAHEIEVEDNGIGDYVKISVADTGIGIKKEDLETIFDRFRQVEGSSSGEQRGTGIGLAYAKELVELMGGRITVQSEYGKGSTFSIYLPIERQEADVEPEALQEKEEELYLQPEVELSDISREEETLEESLSGKKPLILIVDDNPDVRGYVVSIVRKKYDFITAGNGVEALDKLKKHIPDVILCDVMMPKMDGHEFLKRVKSSPGLQKIPFIFLTARADVEMKVEGLEEGADDYIVKPFNSLELLARVKSLRRIRDLMTTTEAQARKIDTLTQKLRGKYRYGNIIGNTPPMRKIYQLIETIKGSSSNVLITGETGTGKELIANAIHYNSPRKKGSLVSVNCGAIPKELMEREFFGHTKGAFTGAVDSKKGYFGEADKGTLFLDEIGEMDKDMQVKLLRVLEQGEITRVGDPSPIKVDVRLIVATNKNLLAEVQQGNFREDLYYRIHVIPIHLPPLRQRSEDIPLLIEHFLESFRSKQKKEIASLTEKEMRLFMSYSYPGNVRELEHMVERFCLLGGNVESLFSPQLGKSTQASSDFLGEEVFDNPKPLKVAAQKAKVRAEREVLLKALKMCDNDYAQTAKKLNICLASLYNKIKDYGVNV
jgi:PAS domain S-box-containing protein